jgi:hypothetical protein
VCGDLVDNDCDGDTDEDCTAGCGPLIERFFDDFDRADGSLGDDWTGLPALIPNAFISNNEACGTEQSMGLPDYCLVDVETASISFDWRPNSDEGQEAWVTIAAETDPPTGVYILGCDGGYNSPIESGQACGLDILDAFGSEVANGGLYLLNPGTTYHFDATITSAGAMSVTQSDGSGVIGTTSGSVASGVDINTIGFIAGRDPNSTTCIDNFDFAAN